jgi:ribosomal protein S18 acetylase RimI-like enzyme
VLGAPPDPKHCKELADFSVEKAKENDAKYILVEIQSPFEGCIREFKNLGYDTVSTSYRMQRSLKRELEHPTRIQCEGVSRSEVTVFFENMRKSMEGSSDVMLEMALPNLENLPTRMLDAWFEQQQIYLAKEGSKTVGVLHLSPTTKTNIANMGVDPKQRGRGYGKEILRHALIELKKSGCKKARLRVHSKNKPAIGLYESHGFNRVEQYHSLMWKPNRR